MTARSRTAGAHANPLRPGNTCSATPALSNHQVSTAYEKGWADLENGSLLRVAEAEFELLITTDQNLRHQQNLIGRRLSILVLPTTSWPRLRAHVPRIAAAIDRIRVGEYVELSIGEF